MAIPKHLSYLEVINVWFWGMLRIIVLVEYPNCLQLQCLDWRLNVRTLASRISWYLVESILLSTHTNISVPPAATQPQSLTPHPNMKRRQRANSRRTRKNQQNTFVSMKASSLTANRASVVVLTPNIARSASISIMFCSFVTASKLLLLVENQLWTQRLMWRKWRKTECPVC